MDVILPLTKPGEEQSCSYENHSSLLSGWQSLAMLSNLYKYGMSTDVRIWSHILFHQAATFLARMHGQLHHKSTPLHMSPSENTTRTSIHLMCNNIRIGQLSETIPGTKKSHQKQVQEQRSYTKWTAKNWTNIAFPLKLHTSHSNNRSGSNKDSGQPCQIRV